MHLTQREKEIARLVAIGQSNKQIAQTLCISVQTVKNILHNVFEKNDISSRTELAIRWLGQPQG